MPVEESVRIFEIATQITRVGCWGCGTCHASCARGALALEPRSGTELASVW